ncbi:MAG: hypothetical protein AAGA66_01940 [Bacteroidota bacterium]
MSLITCFVILSGVTIWLVARDKKTYAHKVRFNRNVGAIFIGACMGLYPALALFFCMVKALPVSFGLLSTIFFLFWLTFTLYAYFIKSTHTINKHALISAGVMGIAIPILNGIQSGIWFWKALPINHPDSFFVDVSWLLGSCSILVRVKTKPIEKKLRSNKPAKKKAPFSLFRKYIVKTRIIHQHHPEFGISLSRSFGVFDLQGIMIGKYTNSVPFHGGPNLP